MKTLAFFLCATAAWADDSLVSIGDSKYLTADFTGGKVTYLKYPTIGCPSIVKAGATGTVWVKLGDGGSTTTFALTLSPNDGVGADYALTVLGSTFANGIYKVQYQVPSSVPEEMFDLHLGVPALSLMDVQYNSFKVVKEIPSNFTFLVTSDTHFNDPQGLWSPANKNPIGYNAYAIIDQMKREFRALRPSAVLLSGDLTFGLDYDYEFEGLWNVWKDAGVPVFMVPGNHDAYSCIEDRWVLGLHSPVRDGLDYFRRYMGPCYYSFEFGGVHFQAVNSADGTPERRDGFLIIIENYGGDLLPEQMDWISADLAGATGSVVPFMHHNPMGDYRPNGTFSLTEWVLNWIWGWITTGNFYSWPGQEWNTQSTGEFLLGQYANLPIVFIGHSHKDAILTYNNTTYKKVTSGGSDSQTYWGYAHVRVENAQVVDYLYLDEANQSIPTGNLHVTVNGSSATVESGLAKSYDVTIPFVMPAAPNYAATNGTVVAFAPIDAATSKVWVKTASPIAADLNSPESSTVTVAPSEAPVVAGSVETAGSGSGGGGGSCGLMGIEIALLGLLRLRRR